LGILLSLVLMLGLMSGMGLTVYAEPTGTGIDGQNNKTNENSTLREESAQTTRPLNAEEQVILEEEKAKVRAQYGENRKITDEQYDKSLAVKCVNGTFVGRKSDGVIAYKGIPFVGKQPVGEYRWKAPVAFEPDDGVYEAYYNAKSAHQMIDFSETASLYYQGEDCLYLDIWTTGNADTEKKPVIVWIHGGGYVLGGTVDPLYDCCNFVKENNDVIFVSIPYRLGVFGFLHLSHLPDGADYPDAQNLGILDQIMALKWIHENIAGFGGDPDRVTVFGESSGGGSASLLPLVPGSHEYIKRVIADSGSPCLTRTTEQAIQCTTELMEELGCKTVADLQKVSIQDLLLADFTRLYARVTPEKDGKWLPLDPYEAYANGAARDIEILQGCNKDESNYYIHACGGVEPAVNILNGVIARKTAEMTEEEKALIESFRNDVQGEDYDNVLRFIDHLWYTAPLIRLSENQTKAGGKSYTWLFAVESTVPFMKCGHSIELATLLNHPEITGFTGRQFDETFSKTMRRMLVQFAKTGNPSLTADISPDGKDHVWPLYDTENKWLMVFEEFDIHPERESDRKLVDWERTYFLTKYYC
jgi:para-nitrobenzyl esterase